MPYIRIGKCVYKKTKKGNRGKKKGCSKTAAKAKKYMNKLYMVDEDIIQEVNTYLKLKEAARDAKILRNINIEFFKKEIPKEPDEEIRDYFAKLQNLEADPDVYNPVFPNELVSWMESLPDSHFPTNGRKRFVKWLANAIYTHETEILFKTNAFDNLDIYNNDVRYISDYFNGAQDIPAEIWNLSYLQVYQLSEDWHHQLAAGLIGKEDLPSGKLNYIGKKVVYKFDNGYSIVEVDPTVGERDYTKEEGLRCGWAHDYEEIQEFHTYYDKKGVSEYDRPNFEIRSAINDLDIEGCAMGHCVGGYCDTVSAGKLTIYSLRSPGNNPHATIDVATSNNQVYQIKGNQNAPPKEKYRPMIKQWLEQSGLNYEQSTDYLNILSPEETFMMLGSGKLPLNQQVSLARDTKNQEILGFFLDKLEDKLDMEDDPEPFGQDAKRLIIAAMAKNHNMNEETRIRLLKINLPRKVLGLQAGRVLGAAMGRNPPDYINTRRLAANAWAELGPEVLSSPITDEKLFYMKVFVEGIETDQSTKEEIIDRIITTEYIEEIISNKGLIRNTSFEYGQVIQEYLQSKSPSEETVSKIYYMQRLDPFVLLLGQVGRLNRYISNSRGMSDKLVDAMIDDIEDNRFWQMGVNDMMDVIRNKKVGDSNKIKILNQERPPSGQTIRMHMTPVGPRGVKFTPRGKSVSRQLKQTADEGFFTEKFEKYLVDEGFLDPIFSEKLRGEKTKATGKDPMFDKAEGEEKEAIMRDVRQMAQKWLNTPRETPPWTQGQLQEEINKYFKNNIFS